MEEKKNLTVVDEVEETEIAEKTEEITETFGGKVGRFIDTAGGHAKRIAPKLGKVALVAGCFVAGALLGKSMGKSKESEDVIDAEDYEISDNSDVVDEVETVLNEESIGTTEF